jgi:ribonuclease-3
MRHASIADTRAESNERLEFLGDAVLGMVVCEHLYQTFPEMLEGDMTKIKSVAVSRKICAIIAHRIGLDKHLLLGKGMLGAQPLPSSLSAAVLESVIGAIYLDAGGMSEGMEAVRDFLMPHIEKVVTKAEESGHQQNFKSVLQQFAQDQFEATPTYVLLDEKGPDHAKCFEVCVQIGANRYPSSWGQSKKQAEQTAALNALEELGQIVETADGDIAIIDITEAAALNDAREEARSEE